MKRKLLTVVICGTFLIGCGPDLSSQQSFELKKLEMQQEHERALARINSGEPQDVPGNQYIDSATDSAYYQDAQRPMPSNDGDSGSSVLGTVAAVGAGALAGYAISELLDDGYRSYTDDRGNTRYVNSHGQQINSSEYDAYKKKHPTKHKISEYNQKGKTLVKTGQEKTIQAATTVKTKTVQAVTHVQKSVSTPKPAPRPAPRPAKRK